jgi:methyl-accepting chemotaxis protein
MKIWHKILLAPAVAVAFFILFVAATWILVAEQNAQTRALAVASMSEVTAASSAAQEVGEVHSATYRLITWIGNLSEDKVQQASRELRARIDVVGQRLQSGTKSEGLSPEEVRLFEQAHAKLQKYARQVEQAVDLSTGDVATGAMMMQAADRQYQEVQKDLLQLVQLARHHAELDRDKAAAASSRTLAILGAFGALGIVAAIALATFVSRRIVRPLQSAIRLADRIADGDLSAKVEVRGSDETGQLLHALDRMSSSLATLVSNVAAGAKLVADTSSQIAQGNLDLSQRTEEQASTLEETASSIEELTSTVGQNAETAQRASQLAVGASQVANKGGEAVGAVVATMTEISDSSRKISDIIGVIDGIAFQTNILALNAAVEAARAGEQGRGFAVVAAEVRTLAQRSAGAAREIKALIGASADRVDAGAKLVHRAGATMQEVVASVNQVSTLITEIAAASEEQRSGIEQVNAAITQMDHVVQQNASLVEEASAATEAMKAEAALLLESVSRFQLQPKVSPSVDGPALLQPGLVQEPAAARLPGPRRSQAVHVAPPASLDGAWQTY